MGLFSFLSGNKGGMEVVRDKLGNWSYMWNVNPFGKSETNFLKWALENPVLFTVMVARAKLYSQMRITAVDVKTDEEVDSPYVKLLSKPNYFQSQQDWLYQQSWFLSASGTNLIYQKNIYSNEEPPKALYNLIPSDIDYKNVLKVNKFFILDQDAKEFEKQEIEYTLDSKKWKFKMKDIIPMYDIANGLSSNSLIKSPSRVNAVSKNLMNIEENMKAKNINLKMAQKFLARNKNNFQGTAGQLHTDDREAIEKVLSEKSMHITSGDIDVQHLVTNLKQLYLDEQLGFDARIVALAFELNENIINFALTGNTFDNQEQGIIRYIQTATQVDADNLMNSLTNSWGLDLQGIKLKASYNHLPIMQTMMAKKIETFTNYQNAIKLALENKTMTEAEAKEGTLKLKKELGL